MPYAAPRVMGGAPSREHGGSEFELWVVVSSMSWFVLRGMGREKGLREIQLKPS